MQLVCTSAPRDPAPRPRLRGPTHLTVLATYRCTAACRECCFESNPSHFTRIPLRRLLRYIDEAATTFGTLQVTVFSGGECFLLGDDLIRAAQRAASHGLAVRCVSNGYWAVSEPAAARWIRRLKAAGLKELNLSTGDEHQQFVPFERVAVAATAAAARGVRTVLVIEAHAGSRFRAVNALSHPLIREFRDGHANADLLELIQNIWIPFSADRSLEPPVAAADTSGGCGNVLDNVVITPDEQLAACCGLTMEHIPELKLGSLREHRMGDLYRAALGDFLKIWLRVEGPENILRFASEKDPQMALPPRSAHPCQACVSVHRNAGVRQILREHYRGKVPEVLFRYHLLQRLQRKAEGCLPRGTQAPEDGGTASGIPVSHTPRHAPSHGLIPREVERETT
ncbi:MAG: radical SAM protein [Acidobacteriota bacterium]